MAVIGLPLAGIAFYWMITMPDVSALIRNNPPSTALIQAWRQEHARSKSDTGSPVHVSLAGGGLPEPGPDLLAGLAAFFEPRRLLGTRLHVVGPRYVPVDVGADLVVADDAAPAAVLADARAALAGFLDPLTGGPDGAGWPFGRPVWVSEVYAVLGAVPLVSYVEGVALTTGDGERVLTDGSGAPVGVALDVDELVVASADALATWTADGRRQAR